MAMNDGGDGQPEAAQPIIASKKNAAETESVVSLEPLSAIKDVNRLIPHLNMGALAQIELVEDQWRGLEKALDRPLTVELRQATCSAIGYFIHSLRLKKQLSTPRQYANELRDRLDIIIGTAENLLAMVLPVGSPPDEIPQLSANEAKSLMGGRGAIWTAAAKASRTTPKGGEVLLVEDHVRALVAVNFPTASRAVRETVINLLRTLQTMRKDITEQPRNQAGADGNYELNLLLVDLLRVAQSAGDNLYLAGHDIRDPVMGKTVKANPAYLFVEEIVRMMLNSAGTLVASLQLDAEAEAELMTRLKDNLDKKPGTLIDPLEAARAVIEGGPREKSAKR